MTFSHVSLGTGLASYLEHLKDEKIMHIIGHRI